MSNSFIPAFFLSLMLSIFTSVEAATPAFPGAEGGGMYTTGGRGGTVYYVNTLSDNSTGNSTTREGSLRWCLSQTGKRTILFKVSGIISLTSSISISKGDVTIAGQTAPGDGICLRYYTTSVGASNVIIRYMRFRLGDTALQEDDAIWGRYQKNVVLDHCSMSWCVDECASFYSNKDFTMQWCLLAESLRNSIHGKGAHGYGGIWGGENVTYHHNMLAHHDSRNPRFNGWKRSGLGYTTTVAEERMDYRNNVVYNWGGNSTYGGEAAGKYNMVNNYYKYGPATSAKNRLAQADIDTSLSINPRHGKYYLDGNYIYGYASYSADNRLALYNKTGFPLDSVIVTTPYACYPVTTHSATTAFDKVLAYVGCSLKRDTVDGRLVQEARKGNFTFTGSNGSTNGLIDTQSDVGGWPTYNATTAPIDTDIDGMPDVWETANGLNPNSAADGNTFTLSTEGYTNLEVYLNSLVNAITLAQNADGVSSIFESTMPAKARAEAIYHSGSLYVRSMEPFVKIELFKLDGRKIFDEMVESSVDWNSNIPNLIPGLYLLKVYDNSRHAITAKVIVPE